MSSFHYVLYTFSIRFCSVCSGGGGGVVSSGWRNCICGTEDNKLTGCLLQSWNELGKKSVDGTVFHSVCVCVCARERVCMCVHERVCVSVCAGLQCNMCG